MDVAGSGDWGGISGLFTGATTKGAIGLGGVHLQFSLGDNDYAIGNTLFVLKVECMVQTNKIKS